MIITRPNYQELTKKIEPDRRLLLKNFYGASICTLIKHRCVLPCTVVVAWVGRAAKPLLCFLANNCGL
jgi:hypothetical protein